MNPLAVLGMLCATAVALGFLFMCGLFVVCIVGGILTV